MSGLPFSEEKRRVDLATEAALRIAVLERPFVATDVFSGTETRDSEWTRRFFVQLTERGLLRVVMPGLRKQPYVYERTGVESERLLERPFVIACLWPGTYGGPIFQEKAEEEEVALTQPGSAMVPGEASADVPAEAAPPEDPMLTLLASFRDRIVAQDERLAHLETAVKQLPAMMAEAIGAAIEDVMARQPPPALPAPDAAAETVRGMLASTNERVTKLEARIVGNTAAINEAAAVGEKIWKRANVVAERINSLDGNIETMGKLLLVLVDHKNMPTSATMPMNLGVLSAIRNGDVKPEPAPTKKAAGK